MINAFVIVAIFTYLLMLSAFYFRHIRRIHVPVMVAVMVFDCCVPFYLFLTRDWKARLIESGDILSFAVWMHFGLVITLYFIYALQIQTARMLLKGSDNEVRAEHGGQGKAILIVRALVILTGAMLIDPELAESGSGSIMME